MVAINLPRALAFILEDEGSELNLGGSEPGGGSKYGVSMVNLVDWNKARGLPPPTIEGDLAKMTPEFASEIYTETFAKPLRFDDMPTGFDYQLLNVSVNLGLHGGGDARRGLDRQEAGEPELGPERHHQDRVWPRLDG